MLIFETVVIAQKLDNTGKVDFLIKKVFLFYFFFSLCDALASIAAATANAACHVQSATSEHIFFSSSNVYSGNLIFVDTQHPLGVKPTTARKKATFTY